MIKLFRKIRQRLLTENKFSKYLIYAIGEIILVVVGILIALQVNSWNESRKSDLKEKYYLESFHKENIENKKDLVDNITFLQSIQDDIDTLRQIIQSKNYGDSRVKRLSLGMTGIGTYNPSTNIIKNIIASSELNVIKDTELREKIIDTYNANDATLKLETILNEFAKNQATPFLWENIRYSDSSSVHYDFEKNPLFENLATAYYFLLNQQISGYQENLEKINILDESLAIAIIMPPGR